MALLLLVSARGRVLLADNCQTFVFDPASGASLPPATVGGTYSERIKVASGATPPITFSSSPTAPLPDGLRLVPTSNDPSAAIIVGSPTQAGIRTFFINAQDKVGCTGFSEYAINITIPNPCNPPVTLDPPGGSLQPVWFGKGLGQTIYARGVTIPPLPAPDGLKVTLSGGPPGLKGFHDFPIPPGEIDLHIPPGLAPGNYSFQVTVTDSRGCSATATYSFTVPGLGAGCVIQLNAEPFQQERAGSAFPVTFSANNIGDAPCVGPFNVTVGPGLTALSTTPGSAFTMAGTSGPNGQQFSGAGTIPGGGFAGVSTLFAATTPGLTQIPVTLQFTSGPGKTDVINTKLTIELFHGRNSERLDTTTARILLGQR
jgi:hypothetical protein